jgi:hypothetical protein
MRPFSQASESNKSAILAVLQLQFSSRTNILEIGSGSGQHAVFFAEHMPWLHWQTSDQTTYHEGICQWIEYANLPNVGMPLTLDVTENVNWRDIHCITTAPGQSRVDGVFSANTAHIMPWNAVVELFRGVGDLLQEKHRFVLYGPFNQNGQFTSPGNQRFHDQLTIQNPAMGIRNDCEIISLAANHALSLVEDVAMPANNRILVFERIKSQID